MTNEQKQLLLRDLCARLPYGVICHYNCVIPIEGREFHKANCKDVLKGIIPTSDSNIGFMVGFDKVNALEGDIKPYLRPIKSMTQEECDKLFKILNIDEDNGDWLKINDIGVLRLFTENGKDFYEIAEAMDYLYSIHIDFRGMIEEGLALKAEEGMYKTE